MRIGSVAEQSQWHARLQEIMRAEIPPQELQGGKVVLGQGERGWQLQISFADALTGSVVLLPVSVPDHVLVNAEFKKAPPLKPSGFQPQDAVWRQVQAECKPAAGVRVLNFYPDNVTSDVMTGIIVWGTDADYAKTPFVIGMAGTVKLPQGCDPRQRPEAQPKLTREWVSAHAWPAVKAECNPPAGAVQTALDAQPQEDGSWRGVITWGAESAGVKTPFLALPQGLITLPEGCSDAGKERVREAVWAKLKSECRVEPSHLQIGYYPEGGADGIWTGILIWGTYQSYVKTPFLLTKDGAVTLPQGCDPRSGR